MSDIDRWAAGLSSDELREAVRGVLRDVLPQALTHQAGAAAGTAAGPSPGPAAAETVAVRTQADLDALVRRIAGLCEDPQRRAALRGGRHGFRLGTPSPAGPPVPAPRSTGSGGAPGPATPAHAVTRVDRGAVTERTVRQAAADGHRLVLGPRAVLTPLARDRARVLGVPIEKER